MKEVDELKQECEELKIYIKSNEQQVKEVETLVMDNDRLINELDQLKANNEKLKQTLAEIKEILEIHKDDKCAICPKFDECFEHPSCDNIILQKISECE